MGPKSMRWADGFIAVDWGTTNRRAYRLDSNGNNVAEFEDHKGILSISDGGFPAAVVEVRERLGDLPLLLAGMVGSNRGWKEAPYVPCPAGVDELVAGLVRAGEREAIVPGVSYVGNGRADVMRGEEVQLLGGLAAGLINPEEMVCHPGTHNKWVTLREGKIREFRTVMTGELFNLLKDHSILSDLLQSEVQADQAFREAARSALDEAALPAQLFDARAAVLLGQLTKEHAASHVSGLLIGADVRIGLAIPTGAQIKVVGRPELTALYAAALAEAKREARELDGERCFLSGAIEIAKRIS